MQNSSDYTQIDVFVNESYAETYINQTYFISNSNPVEFSVELPNKKGVQFVDFEVEIQDKKVKSKLITKEKAEEKYNDAIASGNTGIYSEYDKNLDKYIIHLGNIQPNTKVHFKSHFLQNLISNDLNYFYRLIGQLPFPKSNYFNKSDKINCKVKVFFQTSFPITTLEQKVEGDNPTIITRFNEDKTKYEIELLLELKNPNNYFGLFADPQSYNQKHSASFKFQMKDFKKPKLYKQYDPKNDETTYLLSYFNIINDEENKNTKGINKSFPGLYYFVIDQSGSMAGRPIELVIHTLKVFMQSLSEGSYYQLIGFGTDFKKYSEKPLFYNKENVEKTINEIKKLRGDMGGTDLYQPLEYIYNNYKNNEDLHLPQYIFILTDGETINKEDALNLIEKNNSKYKVFANGIGNGFDQDFITTAAECGFGVSKFINDIENLSVTINEELTQCMRPYYDNVKFKVEKNNNNDILYDFYRNEFILDNQKVDYSFIMKGKAYGNIEIKNNYTYEGKKVNKIFKFNENDIINLKDGDVLAKITIHSLIQREEGDDFSNEENIKKIAKKYQILCQYTSLYAEIENNEEIKEPILNIINNNSNNMKEGLFAKINNKTKEAIFCHNNYNNKSSCSGLFGNSGNIFTYQSSPNLFGNSGQNTNQSCSGLFGNSGKNTNQSCSGLFGNTNKNINQSCSGLFGNSDQNTNQSCSGLFGNNNNTNVASPSLFGNNNTCDKSPGLFGNNNVASPGLFGNNNTSDKSPGLFGSNNAMSHSLFNNNDYSDSMPESNRSHLFENNNNNTENNKNNINDNSNNLFGNNNNNSNSSSLFGNNNNPEYLSNDNDNNYIDNTKKIKENVDVNNTDILEDLIMSLDIIEGSWEENQVTSTIINMKENIYSQVKNLVSNKKIAVTFVVLFYILNDKKEKIAEYNNIINKSKTFLDNNNYSYEYIISNINIK